MVLLSVDFYDFFFIFDLSLLFPYNSRFNFFWKICKFLQLELSFILVGMRLSSFFSSNVWFFVLKIHIGIVQERGAWEAYDKRTFSLLEVKIYKKTIGMNGKLMWYQKFRKLQFQPKIKNFIPILLFIFFDILETICHFPSFIPHRNWHITPKDTNIYNFDLYTYTYEKKIQKYHTFTRYLPTLLYEINQYVKIPLHRMIQTPICTHRVWKNCGNQRITSLRHLTMNSTHGKISKKTQRRIAVGFSNDFTWK